MVAIGFFIFSTMVLHAEEASKKIPVLKKKKEYVAYRIRLTLNTGVLVEGVVMKDRVYEKSGRKGFEVAKSTDEGAGMRLWYLNNKEGQEWKFYPQNKIKSVLTTERFTTLSFEKFKEKWSKKIKAKKIREKKEQDRMQREREEAKKNKEKQEKADKEQKTLEQAKSEKESELKKQAEERTQKIKEIEKKSPNNMTDEEILVYFVGYSEEDRTRLIKKKNSVGSLGALPKKDQNFLKHYSKWKSAQEKAAGSSEE